MRQDLSFDAADAGRRCTLARYWDAGDLNHLWYLQENRRVAAPVAAGARAGGESGTTRAGYSSGSVVKNSG